MVAVNRKGGKMKSRIFPLLFFILVIASSGCSVIETPFQSEMREKTDSITQRLESLSKETQSMKEDVDKFRADTSQDTEGLRQDMAAIKGTVEEQGFDLARIKENMELISSTAQTLDGRIKEIESPKEGKTGNEIYSLRETADELKSTVAALNERIKNIEEKQGAAKKEPLATDATSLYMEGLDLVRVNKDYSKALDAFQRFLSTYPDHELSDNAQYWIGEIYYAQGDWERAIVEFNKVLKQHPPGDKAAAALLKQAFSFEKLGAAKEAAILLKKVITEFPGTGESEMAAKRLKELGK